MGSLALSVLLLAARPSLAQAGGCIVMPDGSCQAEAPRLLPSQVHDQRLSGGVRVVVVPLDSGERLSLDLLLGPGGAARSDLDAVVAGLLEQELADPSGPARRDRRRYLGVTQQVQVEPGRVRIHLEGPVAVLGELLQLEAARLGTFAPTGREIARVRTDLLAASTAADAQPDHLARKLVDHSPSLPLRPDSAQVMDRFEQAWRGASLTVLVAGQVDRGQAVQWVQDAFGEVPAAPDPPARPPPEAPGERLDLSRPSVARGRVLMSWGLEPVRPGTRREAALALLRELLVEPGGTLDERLLVAGLGLRVESRPRLDRLEVLAEVDQGVHPGAVEAALELSAAELLAAESAQVAPMVELARSHLVREAALGLDSPAGWARVLGDILAEGASPGDLDRHVDMLRQVEPAEVLALAREIMIPGARRTVVLSPAPVMP